jgi:large subunit ribosomal protein L1
VADDVGAVVSELKAGKVEYRMDKGAVMHVGIGKASFTAAQLEENFRALMAAIVAARPASVTGRYLRSCAVSSSMGPGIKVALDSFR